MYYVYFLESTRNKKIYVGYSSKNPKERLHEHNHGGDQWTRANGQFLLLYFEEYICGEDARKREKFYKSGFGKEIKYVIVKLLKAKGIVIK